jgi:hypothetical protein
MEYQVVKDGNKYGIWGMKSNCIIVYGRKKSLQLLCNKLNKEDQ